MFDKKKLQDMAKAKMMDALKNNPAAAEQMKRMQEAAGMVQDAAAGQQSSNGGAPITVDKKMVGERVNAKMEEIARDGNDPQAIMKLQELQMKLQGPNPTQGDLDALMAMTQTKRKELPDVDYAGNRPRLVWGAMLDQINFDPNGKYGWRNFTFAFLPTKDVNGDEIRWVGGNDPAKNQQRLHMEIYKDGQMIADHWMYAKDTSRITHYANIDAHTALTTNKDLLNHNSRLGAGKYEFVFKITDDEIYRLEAEVEAVPNPDRYADVKDIMRFNGPHQKYLGVTFKEHQTEPGNVADKDVRLRYMLYHRNPLIQFDRSEQRLFGHLYYEGERIAYTDMQLGADHKWTYKSGDFMRWSENTDPRNSRIVNEGHMMFGDMKDGQYKVVLFSTELDNEKTLHYKRPDGAAKIEYDFEWKNGGFVLPDYMDDRKTDPSKMIEGLGDTIWLEPLNGPHPWLFDENAKQRPATGKNSSWVDPDTRDDDPWALNYSSSDDPKRQRVNELLDKVTAGEMAFEDTGLPEPDETSTDRGFYKYSTDVRAAKLSYDRHMKARGDKAEQEAYKAQRAKEAEETKAEVAKAQAEAQDYAAQAMEEARKAQEEAQRMIKEMQKKHGL